jgi:NAD+ kinase
MTMPIDLVLVRHGESEGNVVFGRARKGDHSGFTPEFAARHSSQWRLTREGQQQAEIAGAWIRLHISSVFDRYYASEYLRAMETAGWLGFGDAAWYCEFYLRERDWGIFDVMSYQERRERYADDMRRRELDAFFWTPPNGESIANLCLRLDRVLDTLHRECSDKRVLIVCHGEVMWGFRVRLERMSQEMYRELDQSSDRRIKFHNCQILHYTRRDPETGRLAPHLNWMRSICPWDLDLCHPGWNRIHRCHSSSADLLALADKTPRLKLD